MPTSDTAHGTFRLPDGEAVCDAPAGSLLTVAAQEAGIVLNVACGGQGVCGGCAVDLLAGRFRDADGNVVHIRAGRPKRVLACRTKLDGPTFDVRVPRRSLVEAGERIVMDFEHTAKVTFRPPVRTEQLALPAPSLQDQGGDLERIRRALRGRGYDGPILASVYVARQADLVAQAGYDVTVTVTGDQGAWHLVRLQPGAASAPAYAAAVDIGTTTVVVALVDLAAGEIVDAVSAYNQQITRCEDLAARISYAADAERVSELRDLVVESTINRLLKMLLSRHGLAAADVVHMSVAGNTVMTHLFCGMSPAGIGGVPFAPVTNVPGPYRAGQLHLAMNAEGFVDLFASAAAYVGGDITADMYVSGMASRADVSVLIDIGTNAEIVVGNRDRMVACAAPAGPAFEGHGMTCGMRAAAGAIDAIAIEALGAGPTYTVIGGVRPVGVCGSGLIDFVAAAHGAGVLSAAGRFTDQAVKDCPRIVRVPDGDGEALAYEIVPAADTDDGQTPIRLTERDIAALLQAKGVIFAALKIAMKHFGSGLDEVAHVYLAGGFARHIDLNNAVAIGMLPDIAREKVVFLGNGSLAGAFVALLDEDVRAHLPHLAAAPTVIELNLDPEFMDTYIMAMMLPGR